MKKIASKSGFTLIEMLATLLILVFLILGIDTGMDSAVRVYDEAKFEANSASMANIVNTSLGDILRYSDNLTVAEENTSFKDSAGTIVPNVEFVFTNYEYGVRDAYFSLKDSANKEDGILRMRNLENGNVVEVYAEYDPDSRGGDPADGRKVKGATIHWVDAATSVNAEVRLYDNLFSDAQPDGPDKDFLECLNPDSLTVLTGCKVESALVEDAKKFDALGAAREKQSAPSYQFMRVGYFCMDNKDCSAEHLVFNRSVLLKDSFKPAK